MRGTWRTERRSTRDNNTNITECFSNTVCGVCVFIVSVRALTQYILVNISCAGCAVS